jgi:hypothetical protein
MNRSFPQPIHCQGIFDGCACYFVPMFGKLRSSAWCEAAKATSRFAATAVLLCLDRDRCSVVGIVCVACVTDDGCVLDRAGLHHMYSDS